MQKSKTVKFLKTFHEDQAQLEHGYYTERKILGTCDYNCAVK